MDTIRAYSTLKSSYIFPADLDLEEQEQESKPRQKAIYSHLFDELTLKTDGELYCSSLMQFKSYYRDDFRELVASIVERFKEGEWQQDKEQEIEKALMGADEPELALQALAIDAFLADATEAEILHFNELSMSDLMRKDLDSKAPCAPKIPTKRGYRDGKRNTHGFFTKSTSKEQTIEDVN